jgi:rubredoxin
MTVYRCTGCDYVYDEAKGAAREGFPPGTCWEKIPEDWCCPDCAVREKIDFDILEVRQRCVPQAAREGIGQLMEVTK